ncbi:MAG: methyl-accepting chemotaxis protein, partial [Planctomycetaceae bacterium]|nr:methyl-accepting chemotaxis protein [Planctomycetaceae bacterium]
MTQITEKTADAMHLAEVKQGSTAIQTLTYEARLEATLGVMFRDEKYSQSRSVLDKRLKQTYDELLPLLQGTRHDENRKDMEAIINEYDRFVDYDLRWYEIERIRKTKVAELVISAVLIGDKLTSLSNDIKAVMVTPQESREIDGQRFISESRTLQLQQCEHCQYLLQELRRFFYQYFSLTDNKAKEDIKVTIKKSIIELHNAYKIVAEKLTTSKGKETNRQIIEALATWENRFNENLDILQNQNELDEKQNSNISKMNEIRTRIDKRLLNQVSNVRKVAEDVNNLMMRAIAVVSVFALLAGVIISYILSRNITSGLRFAMESMNHVVLEGDLGTDIPSEVLCRHDEIGDMARVAGAVLSDYRSIDSMANSLASGNWRITVKEKGHLDTMNQNLNRMLNQVNQALAEINDSVKQVSTGSGEVSSAAQTLSSGAQESSASLEEITASMSEISSQTRANAQGASEARDLALSATK